MMLCEYSSYTGHHKRTMAFPCHYTSLEKRVWLVCKSACLYVRPSVCYGLGYPSLIRNYFYTIEWNLMRLSQILYYLMPLWPPIWLFDLTLSSDLPAQNMDLAIITIWGLGGGYHLVNLLLTVLLVWYHLQMWNVHETFLNTSHT